MENKNLSSPTFKAGRVVSASIWLRKRNTLYREHDQASLLREHNTTPLLCDGKEKCYDKDFAIRLDIIMSHSLYLHIFTKQQQKILKETLEILGVRLYVK
jgi:hypothetical protein